MNLLNNFGIHIRVSSKTIFETIDYEEAPIDRICSFIKNEWEHNCTYLIEDGQKAIMGDKIVSLWV